MMAGHVIQFLPPLTRPASVRRGRGGGYPPPPRTDPGVHTARPPDRFADAANTGGTPVRDGRIAALMRYYRTGLFRQPRFRDTPRTTASVLFPAGRLALFIRPCMSGQGSLCGLRLPVSPFPTPAQHRRGCV